MNDEFVGFMKKDKKQKGILCNYKEGTLTFAPTYKFKIKEEDYDDKREPSYTDRILFESTHDLP
jgi:hypothetical protein